MIPEVKSWLCRIHWQIHSSHLFQRGSDFSTTSSRQTFFLSLYFPVWCYACRTVSKQAVLAGCACTSSLLCIYFLCTATCSCIWKPDTHAHLTLAYYRRKNYWCKHIKRKLQLRMELTQMWPWNNLWMTQSSQSSAVIRFPASAAADHSRGLGMVCRALKDCLISGISGQAGNCNCNHSELLCLELTSKQFPLLSGYTYSVSGRKEGTLHKWESTIRWVRSALAVQPQQLHMMERKPVWIADEAHCQAGQQRCCSLSAILTGMPGRKEDVYKNDSRRRKGKSLTAAIKDFIWS